MTFSLNTFMNIPLDRLYHFVQNTACIIHKDNIVLYRFFPHGSKYVEDLHALVPDGPWTNRLITRQIWCHDQEPLNYADYYYHQKKVQLNATNPDQWTQCLRSIDFTIVCPNLNYMRNIFGSNILLHSEQRSKYVERYLTDGELMPVYYWSHAVIARDWFRYAQHENFEKKISKQFLIYSRAWSGTREYRLKFADLLIENDLINHCETFHNPIDNNIHYKDHCFINPVWIPGHALENYIPSTNCPATASADFATCDYKSTEIEIVLETLYDDDRLHITEKSLRPIACRQPFILLATHGSLQYLRNYGFETFDKVWDESYDQIENPLIRMKTVVAVMEKISTWSDAEKNAKTPIIQEIVDHNQKHFFSDSFFNAVIDELKKNLSEAFDYLKSNPGFDRFNNNWQHLLKYTQVNNFLDDNQDQTMPTRLQLENVLKYIAEYKKNEN